VATRIADRIRIRILIYGFPDPEYCFFVASYLSVGHIYELKYRDFCLIYMLLNEWKHICYFFTGYSIKKFNRK
jgi:hypothetical protein